jgi:N-acetylmuramoyl-L-alanine amidase
MKKILSVVMCLIFVVSVVIVGREAAEKTAGDNVEERNKYCVVIDAGHGGDDPGKVGIGNVLEKDINLQIALILKQYLEEEGIEVIMTRKDSGGLYEENSSGWKVQDMKKRIAIIDEAAPDITVSIHQNSYPEEYVHGAQVFYYEGSVQGEMLAECIQEQLIEKVDPDNKRVIKGNKSYYMLKKTNVPIVIVECGFLSNEEETAKLMDTDYQDRTAWAIHMGILTYLNTQSVAKK